MIVAGGASYGEPEPNRSRRIGAVLSVHRRDFVGDGTTFIRRYVAALKAGCDLLVECAVRKQVARELLDSEAVERKVAVKRLNHPVTIGPHLPIVVDVDAVRIGIPGGIEPIPGAVLAIAR